MADASKPVQAVIAAAARGGCSYMYVPFACFHCAVACTMHAQAGGLVSVANLPLGRAVLANHKLGGAA